MKAVLTAELRRFANAGDRVWDGWCATWATGKTLRQWTVVNALSAILAFGLDLTTAERGLILVSGLLVLAAKLITPGGKGWSITPAATSIRGRKAPGIAAMPPGH